MKVICKEYPKDFDYINLYPISDVHYGAAECMESEFKAYIKRIQADPRGVVVLGGDLINNGIKSSVTNVYEEKYTPRMQKIDMIEMLLPIKDRIIAGVRGNHEYRTIKETSIDVMEDIFRELGIEEAYAQDACFLKIRFGSDAHAKPLTYMLYLAHGSGGGQLLGSGISRQDGYQISIEGVDISITGHTHKPSKTPSARLVFDPYNNRVTRRNTCIFICTSWLDYAGYPERGQMRATAFHPDFIRLDGKCKAWT